MLIQNIKCGICILLLYQPWVYIEKDVVFADTSNPNTSISKIIDLIRPVDEWSDIAFSARNDAENEHWETST